MGIVRFALRFPHTFYVLAGLMLFLGCSAILVAPKDIFPNINIPVVTVIWQYTGAADHHECQCDSAYRELLANGHPLRPGGRAFYLLMALIEAPSPAKTRVRPEPSLKAHAFHTVA